MRIAQIAPLYETVPPKFYGGTERVVSWLTEEFVEQGHKVTLFASGDSLTKAELVPVVPRALRLEEGFMYDKIGCHALMLEKLLKIADQFDVIHFHSDYMHLPYVRLMRTPSLTTMHCRMDYFPLLDILKENDHVPVVSISDSQRRVAPWLSWQRTIYHGLPKDLYNLNEKPSDYILFLGRLCPEKRPDRAIEIARKAGIKLKIAAKVDPVDRTYFEEELKPLLKDSNVEYLGEVNDAQKQDLIGNAYALIHPIEFPEPFGLVMIEAMACGTPIVAFRTGSIPEVIDEGQTGFVVEGIDAAVAALAKVEALSRRKCREVFDKRFTSTRMVHDYLNVYESLVRSAHVLEFAPEKEIVVQSTAVVPSLVR
jgi:glycosyltransferase involved in cell wall biosynthesis